MYQDLHGFDFEEAFRCTWIMNRSFEFVKKERATTHGKKQIDKEHGKWLALPQLREKLGAPALTQHYKSLRENE